MSQRAVPSASLRRGAHPLGLAGASMPASLPGGQSQEAAWETTSASRRAGGGGNLCSSPSPGRHAPALPAGCGRKRPCCVTAVTAAARGTAPEGFVGRGSVRVETPEPWLNCSVAMKPAKPPPPLPTRTHASHGAQQSHLPSPLRGPLSWAATTRLRPASALQRYRAICAPAAGRRLVQSLHTQWGQQSQLGTSGLCHTVL